MRVAELMTKQVKSCRSDETLDWAARLMWDHDCGCLPVCAGNGISRVIGMITDRDICMSALFQGKPLSEMRVSDAMSRQLQMCRPQDSLADAEKIMRQRRIRRLPVVDEQGALVGMLALADLAQQAARERTAAKQEITETEIGNTLGAICEPSAHRFAA